VGGVYATGRNAAEVRQVVNGINWDQVMSGQTPFDDLSFRRKEDARDYPNSLESYRSVLLRFPKSTEAYKAQFMIAFTYSEYLKVDKIAVAEYQKVKDNYPTCDLFNDADWMIRNIQSGGQLMPKFDDSAFVADSIARTDSLKKHGVKDTAKTDSAKAAKKVVAPVKVETAKATAATDSTKAAKKVVAPAKADAAKATAKIDSTKAGHPARDSAAAAR